MCLILFLYEAHSDYRLILGANRDEFHERPTAPLSHWHPGRTMPGSGRGPVLSGRDLRGGGTWMGVARDGRFAALTNYRDPSANQNGAPTRGALVTDYLAGRDLPLAYLEKTARTGVPHNGFNLLAGDRNGLFYYSNRGERIQAVAPGIHGLSNRHLDSPWPKVVEGKRALARACSAGPVSTEAILEVLANQERPSDDRLPDTGIGLEWERLLSPVFITSPAYGTRSSSVLLVGRDGEVCFVERTFTPEGDAAGTRRFQFKIPM